MAMKIQHIVLCVLLAYAALYAAIWLHELGHALVYHHLGCKAGLFRLHVPWHFAAASPEPVDADCAASLEAVHQLVAALGGITANLVLAAGAWAGYRRLEGRGWPAFVTAVFVLANLTEAATYLTLNNLFPAGDMIPVQQYFPALRLPLGLLGLGLLPVIARFLKILPPGDRRGLGIFCIATAACMFGMRLLFAS